MFFKFSTAFLINSVVDTQLQLHGFSNYRNGRESGNMCPSWDKKGKFCCDVRAKHKKLSEHFKEFFSTLHANKVNIQFTQQQESSLKFDQLNITQHSSGSCE